MYQFELAQQIGLPGIALAGVGLLWLLTRPRMALLVGSAWLTAFLFAYTYNVGDTHVFFLPSHQMVMLACACGAAGLLAVARLTPAAARAWVLSVTRRSARRLSMWRAWDTWPAVDRHDDQRPVTWLSAVAHGLGEPDVLLADVNWQLENGFDYYQRHLHPELNMVRATDAILTLSTLVHNNLEDGRNVYATPVARDRDTGGLRRSVHVHRRSSRRRASAGGEDRDARAGHTVRPRRAGAVSGSGVRRAGTRGRQPPAHGQHDHTGARAVLHGDCRPPGRAPVVRPAIRPAVARAGDDRRCPAGRADGVLDSRPTPSGGPGSATSSPDAATC